MKTSNILNRFDLFPDAEVVEDSDGDEIRRHTAKLDSEYGQKYGAHPLSSVVKGPAANLILASMGYFSYFKRNEDDSAWMVQFKGSRSEAEKLAKLLRRSVKSKKIWEYRSPLFVVYSDNGKGGIIRNEPPAPEVKKEGIPEKRNKLENRITDFFPQAKVKFEGNASRGYRVHVVPPRKANIKPFYISFMTFEEGMEKFEDLMNKHGIRTASKGEKMSTKLKNQLIKLGSTNPELRPHLRPILARMKTALDVRHWESVMDILESVFEHELSEPYDNSVFSNGLNKLSQGKLRKSFGSSGDLGYFIGTGHSPAPGLDSIVTKAEDAIYEDVMRHYSSALKDVPKDSRNYNDLYELGYGDIAEEIDEAVTDISSDEWFHPYIEMEVVPNGVSRKSGLEAVQVILSAWVKTEGRYVGSKLHNFSQVKLEFPQDISDRKVRSVVEKSVVREAEKLIKKVLV